MIRVTPQSEPDIFDERVRKPGRKFLDAHPNPSAKEIDGRDYWTRIEKELRISYGGICAYMGNYVLPCTGNQNVEHFLPKSLYPQSAYEWSNYRFVCSRLNGRKGDYTDVLDPFTLIDGWLVLDFSTLIVKPALSLTDLERAKVEATISRLKLNDDDSCVVERGWWLDLYISNGDLQFLANNAPFIARELLRQGLETEIKDIRKRP